MRTNPRGRWSSSCSCGRLPEGKLCPALPVPGEPGAPGSWGHLESPRAAVPPRMGARAGHQVPSGLTSPGHHCHPQVQPQPGFLLEYFLVFPLSQQLLDAPCAAHPAHRCQWPHLVPPLTAGEGLAVPITGGVNPSSSAPTLSPQPCSNTPALL